MNEEKFKEDLIEVMYKHNLSVEKFCKLVNKVDFWVDKISKKQLAKLKSISTGV